MEEQLLPTEPFADTGSFVYAPLSEQWREIRLITILPGYFDDDVRVSIEHRRLETDDPPEYWALSYVWGSTDDHSFVTVEDGTNPAVSSAKIAITQNLLSALQHIRGQFNQSMYWIDAICINQRNVVERGQQVAIMAHIYRTATRVLAWLGPSTDNSTLGFDVVRRLGAEATPFDLDHKTYGYAGYDDSAIDQRSGGNFSLNLETSEVAAYRALIFRPWFDRVWIRQEIGLGYKNALLMCGNDTIPWTTFYSVVFHLQYFVKSKSRLSPKIRSTAMGRRETLIRSLAIQPRMELSYALRDARASACSDPRDRVYSVLSFTSHSDLVPDYQKSVSDVYREIARLLYTSDTFNLQLVLASCSLDSRRMAQLPSWAPDWNVPSNPDEGLYSTKGFGSLLHLPEFTADGVLGMAGVLVDTITTLRPSGAWRADEVGGIEGRIHARGVIRNLVPFIGPDDLYQPRGTPLLEAYAKTLVSGFFEPSIADNGEFFTFNSELAVRSLKKLLYDDDEKFLLCESSHSEVNVDHYIARVTDAVWDRSMALTEKGYVTLVPREARLGDMVCHFVGSALPMIIRGLPEKSRRYAIVGPAYVEGLMNEEALFGELPAPYKFARIRSTVQNWTAFWNAFKNVDSNELQWLDPRYRKFLEGDGVDLDPSLDVDEAYQIGSRITMDALRNQNVDIVNLEVV